MKIWFTSDPHFGHKNMCRGVSDWEDKSKCRDFNTLEEMNDAIVKGINDHVGKNDILYCLGDWSFGGLQNVWEFRKRINCENIYLTYGNHDHHIENNRLIPLGEDSTSEYSYTYARTLFKSTNHILIKTIGGIPMTLCHYGMRTWDKAHHGSWMLFGHSHNTLGEYTNTEKWVRDAYDENNPATDLFDFDNPPDRYKYKTQDVGVDVAFKLFGEYRPFSLEDDLIPMFKERCNLTVDHHNKNTN